METTIFFLGNTGKFRPWLGWSHNRVFKLLNEEFATAQLNDVAHGPLVKCHANYLTCTFFDIWTTKLILSDSPKDESSFCVKKYNTTYAVYQAILASGIFSRFC